MSESAKPSSGSESQSRRSFFKPRGSSAGPRRTPEEINDALLERIRTYEYHKPLPEDEPCHCVCETGERQSSYKWEDAARVRAQTLPPKLLFSMILPATPGPGSGGSGGEPMPSRYRGLVVFAHGILEHQKRYTHVMRLLAHQGFVVAAQDLLSHGQSDCHPKGRGHIPFSIALADFVGFVQEMQALFKPASGRTFLWGQSYGGLLTTAATLELQDLGTPPQGLVLTSAAIGIPMTLDLKVKNAFAPVLTALAPGAKIVEAAPPEKMSSDAAERERYVQDPLNVPGAISVITGVSTGKAMDEVQVRQSGIVVPLLALHGEKDAVCDVTSVKRLVNAANSSDKRFQELPGAWHTCFHEPAWREAHKEMSDWLTARAPEVFDQDYVRSASREVHNQQQTWMYRRSAFECDTEEAGAALSPEDAEKAAARTSYLQMELLR